MPTRYLPDGRARRGTSNSNDRGNTKDRAARRAYLLRTYRADFDMVVVTYAGTRRNPQQRVFAFKATEDAVAMFNARLAWDSEIVDVKVVPACRCYHCGMLLHEGTLTVDRIKPGCQGGTYRRENIRPACGQHNSELGAPLRSTSGRTSPGGSRVPSRSGGNAE